MHHVYTTKAFIIHSTPHGEAGKFLLLFTKDFGMISATAQGIRLGQSKLRYHIQDYDFSNVSIVRGKDIWRITGAHEVEHRGGSIVHLKILKLLKRLLHGEEKNDELFEIIESLHQIEIKEDEYDLIECLTVLRILNTLGYIRNIPELELLLKGNDLNHEVLEHTKSIKLLIIKIINESLKASHL